MATNMWNILKDALSVLKELYHVREWYDKVGAKEELLERITKLSPVEKCLLGIQMDSHNE